MLALTRWFEAVFNNIPLPLLEVWGRFGFLIGLLLMVGAYGGFTFRPGDSWGLGRIRQSWDFKALGSVALTFVLILGTGWIGSHFVLVPGAQTFESLKDLSVFVCVLLFGPPALLAVPVAYGLSDLIEGVPPAFLLDWLVGYFINPACFWVAFQFIGKNPDFRRARTWGWYVLFVVIFMAIEPELWGYICSGKFTPELSFRNITPALFFTTSVTWVLAPFVMLLALPIARRTRMFWAEIPGHVQERRLGDTTWTWQSGSGEASPDAAAAAKGVPVRMFLAAPYLALVLLMVGTVAYVTVRSGQDAADKLAGRLHEEISDNINLKLDRFLEATTGADDAARSASIDSLLAGTELAKSGRAFIIDRTGHLVASSNRQRTGANDARSSIANRSGDVVVEHATRALEQSAGSLSALAQPTQFRFDIVSAKPLGRESWLAQATPYEDNARRLNWIEVTAIPAGYYLAGAQTGSSRAAMVFAVGLLLALLLAVLLASIVTSPIRRIARSANAVAQGDLGQRVPDSRLAEVGALSGAFNHMAGQLQESFERTSISEAELRRHRDNLEELVAARTSALAIARDDAESANRAKSVFLASMSHELRTPLNAVLGFAQLMSRDPTRSPKDAAQLEKISSAGEHLLTLINDVLSLSRIEANRMTLNVAPFDTRKLVASIEEMIRGRASAKQLTVSVDVDPRVPNIVQGDAGKLRQVLLNLLTNAVKFTHEGGVRLRVLCGTGDDVRFEVSDSGPGISAEEMPRLFGAFVQTTAGGRSAEGSGLGLYLSQSLTRLMGGEIRVESEPGQGATFTFEIPLAVTEAVPSAPQARRRLRVANGQAPSRQLVADDNADNRELLGEFLRLAGFPVQSVANGQEAIDVWTAWQPEVVWMDMRMPVMDGYEAARRIRQLEVERAGRRTVIVGVTASVLDRERDAVLAAGCDASLHKPFRESDLFDILAAYADVRFEEETDATLVVAGLPDARQVAALDQEWCKAFVDCLLIGDVEGARRRVTQLDPMHGAVSTYLTRCLQDFRLDDMERLFASRSAT